MEESYNGWKNYETWNVALWIQNDESLYDIAKSCKRTRDPYKSFVEYIRELNSVETQDGVAWNDSGLDIDALNEMIGEL